MVWALVKAIPARWLKLRQEVSLQEIENSVSFLKWEQPENP